MFCLIFGMYTVAIWEVAKICKLDVFDQRCKVSATGDLVKRRVSLWMFVQHYRVEEKSGGGMIKG